MPKQIPNLYRWIVEMSSMSNNDEWVYHKNEVVSFEEFHERYEDRMNAFGECPRLVICRPVFQEELDEGLNAEYKGDAWDEKAPKITKTLDGLYQLINNIHGRLECFNEKSKNPTHIVESIIAQNFYDCMSGGMPIGMIGGCRMMIKYFDCDLDAPVYPGKIRDEDLPDQEGWYTLRDFMVETKDFDFTKELGEHAVKLLSSGGK